MRVPPPSSTSSIPFRLSQNPSNKVLRLAFIKLAAPFVELLEAEILEADITNVFEYFLLFSKF